MQDAAQRVVLTMLLALGAGLLLPARAEAAGGRAVVLPFKGPAARKARRGFLKALRRQGIKLLRSRSYLRFAKRMGVGPRTSGGMVQVCRRLRCDAVIEGQVRRGKGRRRLLAIAVHDGATGQVLASEQSEAASARRLYRAGLELGARLGPVITVGERGTAGGAEAAVAGGAAAAASSSRKSPRRAQPQPTEGAAVVVDDDPPLRQPSIADSETAAQPLDADDTEPLEPSPVASASAAAAAAGEGSDTRRDVVPDTFTLWCAMGFALRNHELSTSGLGLSYDSGAYVELTVGAEVYPAARLTRSHLRHVGLGVSYSRQLPFGTQSVGTRPGEEPVSSAAEVDTESQQLLLDARVRWLKLDGSWSPTITAFAGWGFRDFEPTDSAAYPRFDYQFIYLGVNGLIPFGTPLAALDLGLDVRPLLKLGQGPADALGERDGLAIGWSVRAGFSGRLAVGLTYFAMFEYLSLRAEFSGRPELPANRTTPLRRIDPSTSVDSYIRAWAGLGYTF